YRQNLSGCDGSGLQSQRIEDRIGGNRRRRRYNACDRQGDTVDDTRTVFPTDILNAQGPGTGGSLTVKVRQRSVTLEWSTAGSGRAERVIERGRAVVESHIQQRGVGCPLAVTFEKLCSCTVVTEQIQVQIRS